LRIEFETCKRCFQFVAGNSQKIIFLLLLK
jgi:hypothetical protein